MAEPPARTAREVHDELAELTAAHLKHLETATFIPMSKQQMFEHGERLDRILKLSDEYLDLLWVESKQKKPTLRMPGKLG